MLWEDQSGNDDKMRGLTDGVEARKPSRSIVVAQVGCKKHKSETRNIGPSMAFSSGWWQMGSGHTEKTEYERRYKRTVNRRKGQDLISDDWRFKAEPRILREYSVN